MIKDDDFTDLHTKLMQELRRGVLVLAALSQLQEAKYGYALMSSLAAKGLEIEQGTLYPLLRRLESQGLLQSEWNVDGSHPRRYYVISPAGLQMLEKLASDWGSQVEIMNKLLDEGSSGGDYDESD